MRPGRSIAIVVAWSACSCQGSEPPPPRAPASIPTAPSSSGALPTAPTTSSAGRPSPPPPSSQAGTDMRKFEDDLQFLHEHDPNIKVLESPTGARIAVSGKYQARVMTSAVEAGGASLGFVNRSFIAAQRTGTAFDNYGGEDRFWLGPEGGQYALYFAPGKPFEFDNWQTPNAFQVGEWPAVPGTTPQSLLYQHSVTVTNYAKTELSMHVERELSLLDAEHVQKALGIELPASVKWVGFASTNRIKNTGSKPWTEAGGLPSIWILGMFAPAPDARIIAPFETKGSGDVVSDRYFGKIPPERLRVNTDKGFLSFKADGKARGKIGLSPSRAKPVLGSYSAAGKVLTLVRFTKPAGATRYVNNLWEISKDPYGGDVSNAYNDGPVEPGKPSLGGFYELESSSPAAALAPGKALSHTHETYHFVGSHDHLDAIAKQVLGVSLSDVENPPL
jgi:hypothetical protein